MVSKECKGCEISPKLQFDQHRANNAIVLPWSLRPNLPAPICLCHHSSPGTYMLVPQGCSLESGEWMVTKGEVRVWVVLKIR